MLPKPRQREFGLMQNWQEIHMLNQKSHHLPRPQSPEKPLLSMAMAFAQEVAAKFKKLETGYRNGLYNFLGKRSFHTGMHAHAIVEPSGK